MATNIYFFTASSFLLVLLGVFMPFVQSAFNDTEVDANLEQYEQIPEAESAWGFTDFLLSLGTIAFVTIADVPTIVLPFIWILRIIFWVSLIDMIIP